MSRLLLRRVEKPTIKDSLLVLAIRHTVESIIDIYHEYAKLSKDEFYYILCTTAVCHLGSLETAELMASESYHPTQAACHPIDLLTAAALLGSLEIVDMLLSKGAQVNSASRYFGTPLKAAAGQGHHEMVLHLLKHAANVNYVCGRDGTALRSASRRNHVSVVQSLLDPAHNLEFSGGDYEIAMLDAARSGHVRIVRLLLEKSTSARKLSLQYEVLWAACKLGHVQLVQMMLDEGLKAKMRGLEGSLALEFAACFGHGLIVSLLLDQVVDLHDKGVKCNAIHAAASNGYQEIVQILLDKGADINFSSASHYETPLLEAARNQQLDMMRFLLNNGACLKTNECGDQAFHYAVIRGHDKVVCILAEAGVNVDGDPDDPKFPPILLAMRHGHEKMVELLLKLGARWVDPLKSAWADQFLDGTYPYPPPPKPLLMD